MRVLVADQDISFLENIKAFLRNRGHEALIAHDALGCMTVLREFRPDVVAIGTDLLWGGSEGVLDAMLEDNTLYATPLLLLLENDDETSLQHHPMVVSTARRQTSMSDLARQLQFLSRLPDNSCTATVGPACRLHHPISMRLRKCGA